MCGGVFFFAVYYVFLFFCFFLLSLIFFFREKASEGGGWDSLAWEANHARDTENRLQCSKKKKKIKTRTDSVQRPCGETMIARLAILFVFCLFVCGYHCWSAILGCTHPKYPLVKSQTLSPQQQEGQEQLVAFYGLPVSPQVKK